MTPLSRKFRLCKPLLFLLLFYRYYEGLFTYVFFLMIVPLNEAIEFLMFWIRATGVINVLLVSLTPVAPINKMIVISPKTEGNEKTFHFFQRAGATGVNDTGSTMLPMSWTPLAPCYRCH
jgi:hypothetical protein